MAGLAGPGAAGELTSGLGSLPDDLLRSILGRVSQLSRSYSHALVCRHWAALAPSAQLSCAVSTEEAGKSGREQQESKYISQVSQELSLFPSLTSLDIHTTPESQSRRLPDSFISSVSSSSLQHLRVGCKFPPQTFGYLPATHAPQALASFQSLHTLSVPYNIPDDDWPLAASLRYLSVRDIPAGVLEKIWELRELRVLKACVPDSVRALPESMSRLTNLEELSLLGYGLESLFSGIGNCWKLRELSLMLEDRHHVHLPPSLTRLGCLSYLFVRGGNVIAPPGMKALTSLRTIECVSPCEIGAQALFAVPSLQRMTTRSLPTDMSMLAFLRELHVYESEGNGGFPESMWALGNLRVLKLTCLLDLREIPESIRGLSGLEELMIKLCLGMESLPDALALLPHLRKVSLCGTGLRYLPPFVDGSWPSLQSLHLRGNKWLKISGVELGALLSKMKDVQISNCPGIVVSENLSDRIHRGDEGDTGPE